MIAFLFSFPADVWGTVSDWLMIAVTGITAYFLYKTLKSQKEVQQAQNKLLEIEQFRLREAFKPDLQYHVYHDTVTLPDEMSHLVSIAVMNHSQNPALNIKHVFLETEKLELLNYKPNPQNLIKSEDRYSLHFFVKGFEKSNQIYFFDFIIKYQDCINTQYRQKVNCIKPIDNDLKVIESLPETIN